MTTIGVAGERAARTYLEAAGLRFREANARVPHGELDLVMDDPATGELVFVEVRARSGASYGTPEDSIGINKQRVLARSIAAYCQRIGWEGQYRLDVIGVLFRDDKTAPAVTHTKYVAFI